MSCCAMLTCQVTFTSTPPVPGQRVSEFEDPPAWAGTFGAAGLQPLAALEPSTSMADVNIGEPAEAELAQLRYWRPDVLSDLLFNWWD